MSAWSSNRLNFAVTVALSPLSSPDICKRLGQFLLVIVLRVDRQHEVDAADLRAIAGKLVVLLELRLGRIDETVAHSRIGFELDIGIEGAHGLAASPAWAAVKVAARMATARSATS